MPTRAVTILFGALHASREIRHDVGKNNQRLTGTAKSTEARTEAQAWNVSIDVGVFNRQAGVEEQAA